MTPEHEFGTPQVDVHKRTTKVNFAVVAAVVLFLISGGIAAYFFSQPS
jgi:hypothetical protein